MHSSHALTTRLALILGLIVLFLGAPAYGAVAGCAACTPVTVTPTTVGGALASNPNASLLPASSGYGKFSVTLYSKTGLVNSALPVNLPSGTYQAWCGTQASHAANGDPQFTATTFPTANIAPATLGDQLIWNRLNYILNHKQGTISDIQTAIWATLGTFLVSDLSSDALAVYNAALTNGPTYTPGPGEITMVLLITSTTNRQHLILEVKNCGFIGNRVWRDLNNDGLQDVQMLTNPNPLTVFGYTRNFDGVTNPYIGYQYTEPGINGVSVDLLDANGTVLATTVTAPSPNTYPYLPVGADGWYTFDGLCAGSYSVRINTGQTALLGMLPSPELAGNGANAASDSNPNPASATLAPTLIPRFDMTLDFGFAGAPPVAVTCASSAGQSNLYYESYVKASGGVPPYTFSTDGALPPGLTLNATSGLISGTPNAPGTYSFTVKVADSTGLAAGTATSSCGITITAQPIGLSCAGGAGQVGAQYTSALTASGGVTPYSFSISSGALPPGLALDGTTGAITGYPQTAGTYAYTAKVVDHTGSSAGTATTSCSIIAGPSGLSLSCASATVTQGVSYVSRVIPSGGTGPYTFSIVSGSLPPGITLDGSTGVISGIPSTSGTYSFTTQVTSGAGAGAVTATSSCTITVNPPIAVSCPAAMAFVGGSYSSAVVVTGGSAHFVYEIASGMLPDGLQLNSATGVISGTPTLDGTFAVTIRVTDTVANTTATTSNCAIQIYKPPTLACNAPVGIAGAAYTASLVASGGLGRYSYSATGGLPAGLTLNSATGAITGTPSQPGPFSFTGQVTDGAGSATTAVATTCSNKIVPPVSGTCAVIQAVQGVAITPVTMTAAGGQGGPYTFSAVGLPAGLTMASDGTISGTPAASGTFSYTVTITDSQKDTGTVNCSITVAPPPPISATCATILAVQGVAITPVTMAASGGVGGPYTFAASGLPAGITMSANGTISGTATVYGTFSYTVTVTDSKGNTGSFNCSVTVAAPPISATCASAAGQVGSPYSSGLTAAGGTGMYTYSIAVGSLPPGLSLNAATGAISGSPTTAGTYSFTAMVTDASGASTTTNCTITIAAANACGLTWGYWKNHVSLWPVTSMMLGSQSYSQAELQAILAKSVAGDQSVELAHQLIAAKFNVLNGTNFATANGAITTADGLLAQYSGKLPYKVATSTAAGAQMVTTARQLDTFNSDGKAQPGCTVSSGGCGGSIGNYIWVDANGNGVQDLNEPGLAGVTVRLRDANNNLLQTTTTDANGQYEFLNLCPGAYVIEVVTPAGYTPTIVATAAAGGDRDSNQNPTTVVLTTGNSTNMDTDFGFVKSACTGAIGSFVWKDSNGNGIQDAGEPGIPGVTIGLYDASSVLLQSAITDATGAYQLSGVCAGTWYVYATMPPGYVPTVAQAGNDRAKDSNPNPRAVTLSTSTSSDLTVDFGYRAVTGGAGAFTTYTQGGWGAAPKGNNAGSLLQANFGRVYPSGSSIGGGLKLSFSSAVAVEGFLPQGGTAGVLAMSAQNPTTSAAGVLGGQVLALELSVDVSNAGVTKAGLGALKVVSGKLAGYTVAQVLALGNGVIGGSAALPAGVSLADLNAVIDSINNNFDNGTVNKGYLQ